MYVELYLFPVVSFIFKEEYMTLLLEIGMELRCEKRS